jgi:hypothetical protein
MADYFTNFSFMFTLPDAEAQAYALELAMMAYVAALAMRNFTTWVAARLDLRRLAPGSACPRDEVVEDASRPQRDVHDVEEVHLEDGRGGVSRTRLEHSRASDGSRSWIRTIIGTRFPDEIRSHPLRP